MEWTACRRFSRTTRTIAAPGSSTWSSSPAGIDRDRLITVLEDQGIQSRPYLPCIHLQTYMRERYGFREWMFPVAEETSRKTLALPFHSAIDPEDQERVVDALRSAIA